MLTYLLLALLTFAAFAAYKYFAFRRKNIASNKDSLLKFFKFWLRRLPHNSNWEHFVEGKGTFHYSSSGYPKNEHVFGGGISGTW